MRFVLQPGNWKLLVLGCYWSGLGKAYWTMKILNYFFPKPEPVIPPSQELSDLKAKYEALNAEHEALKAEHAKLAAGQVQLLTWVKTTHRLNRAPEGIRALIQEGKRIIP